MFQNISIIWELRPRSFSSKDKTDSRVLSRTFEASKKILFLIIIILLRDFTGWV